MDHRLAVQPREFGAVPWEEKSGAAHCGGDHCGGDSSAVWFHHKGPGKSMREGGGRSMIPKEGGKQMRKESPRGRQKSPEGGEQMRKER